MKGKFIRARVKIFQKFVRCKVRGINSAMKIHRKFTSDTPYFFKKMFVVKWEESSKSVCLFRKREKFTKSLHSHTRSLAKILSV